MLCAFDFKSKASIKIHHKLYRNVYLRLCSPISVVKVVFKVCANRKIKAKEGYPSEISNFEMFKKFQLRIKFTTLIEELNFL